MLNVVCAGTLISYPKSRTSANGKPYATATLRVACEGSDAVLVSVIAFSPEAAQALMALAKADACAVAGRASLSSWEKDGEQRHGLSVVADRVVSAYQAGKQRKAARNDARMIEASGMTLA